MIEASLVGIGPNMVQPLYAHGSRPSIVNRTCITSHQITAERGLPALAVWLWFIAGLSPRSGSGSAILPSASWRQWFHPPSSPWSRQRVRVPSGIPFLMLFLILVTLPFAADRTLARQPNI